MAPYDAGDAMLLSNLVTESISGSVVPLAMFDFSVLFQLLFLNIYAKPA